MPLNLEYKLEVWDSPNSAGIVIDAVRAAKIALDRHLAGPVLAPSSYFMKSPAVQHEDGEARRLVEEFIKGEVEGSEEQLDADVAAARQLARMCGALIFSSPDMRNPQSTVGGLGIFNYDLETMRIVTS